MSAETERRSYLAVDLGASSGRVIAGLYGSDGLSVVEVHRFRNEPVTGPDAAGADGMWWDLPELFQQTLVGLALGVQLCSQHGATVCGIGVDSWGVDYVLLDDRGEAELPGESYRSAPDPAAAIQARGLSEQAVFELSGIADLPINTALRLAAADGSRLAGKRLLFLPDQWIYWLTGTIGTDPTIASTSQLLDIRSGAFSPVLRDAAGARQLELPPVRPVGSKAGLTLPAITTRIGAGEPVRVFRVAGHDTAAALASAPAGEALVSCGTWSLVGAAVDAPLTTESVRRAGYSNERGVDGVLLLKNLTGMWMLQECARVWGRTDIPALVQSASALAFDPHTFDASDPRLFRPGDMPALVRQLSIEAGRPEPTEDVQIVRAVLDSLAATYAATIAETATHIGRPFSRLRIVGGGARIGELCQLTADLTGLDVVAGPFEASAIGNLAIQCAADQHLELSEVYAVLRDEPLQSYVPNPERFRL